MLDTELSANPTATTIACGLIVAALIDALIRKGTLSRDEATSALEKAMDGLAAKMMTPEGSHASRVIASVARHATQRVS